MADATLEHRPTATARPAASRGDDAGLVDLAVVGRLLLRRWWLIALITAIFLGLAGAYVVVSPKTWRASTRVLLDPREKQLVGADVGRPQYTIEVGWVETRAELVKSYGNLAEVVKAERLTDDPEFGTTTAADAGSDAAVSRAVRNLADKLLVERPKENNLIDVTVTTREPEKSARLSLAVASAFVRGLAQAKVDQIEQANELLSRQVESMRKKMQAAEAKVEDYKRANGIEVTRGNLVDEETLRQLNESLVSARQKAQEARERWDKLKQMLKSGEVQVPAGLDGVGASVLSRLKIEAALTSKRRTEVEQEYGPLHPKARAALAEIDRDRSLILDQVKSLAGTAEIDYQIARGNEENVRKNLDRARARLADTGQATVALQELVNEAQARRELYKSFVTRMEETNLQKTTQISDATIVSPAQVPLKPYSPRTTIALGLALLAGLGAGVSAALLGGRREVAGLLAARAQADAPSETTPPTAADPWPERRDTPEAPRRAATSPGAFEAGPEAPPSPVDLDHPEPAAATDAAASELPSAPIRVDVALLPERIARLAATGASGAAIRAFVETADGRTDHAGLAMLRRLVDELGRGDRPDVRVIFADTVPSAVVAALAHGLVRAEAEAGGRVMLIDLSGDAASFDEVFDRAAPIARSRRRRMASGFDLRADDNGVVFARPTEDGPGRTSSHGLDRLADFVAESLRDHDGILIHLGSGPSAALLFDTADIADHVTLVVDGKDLAGRRLPGEIDVMRGLLPHFDGILVLEVANEPSTRDVERRRGRRG